MGRGGGLQHYLNLAGIKLLTPSDFGRPPGRPTKAPRLPCVNGQPYLRRPFVTRDDLHRKPGRIFQDRGIVIRSRSRRSRSHFNGYWRGHPFLRTADAAGPGHEAEIMVLYRCADVLKPARVELYAFPSDDLMEHQSPDPVPQSEAVGLRLVVKIVGAD